MIHLPRPQASISSGEELEALQAQMDQLQVHKKNALIGASLSGSHTSVYSGTTSLYVRSVCMCMLHIRLRSKYLHNYFAHMCSQVSRVHFTYQ